MKLYYPPKDTNRFGYSSIYSIGISAMEETDNLVIPSAELLDFLDHSTEADFFMITHSKSSNRSNCLITLISFSP